MRWHSCFSSDSFVLSLIHIVFYIRLNENVLIPFKKQQKFMKYFFFIIACENGAGLFAPIIRGLFYTLTKSTEFMVNTTNAESSSETNVCGLTQNFA